jgi:histidine triad (HIT) family protein
VDGCLFCAIAAGSAPATVVATTPETVAFLDVRPVFKGHLLVVPRRHVDTLVELPDDLLPALFAEVRRLATAVTAGLGAGGTLVAVKNRVSQSVPHLHVHVVPRTRGDGLRGFLWPRHRYADDAEAASYRDRITAAL